ncbi:uncharacterized protein E6C27_scaffold60G00190 [Cucumis melo var. makuwa]|uniref:Uncharacterized protein n=1 Tax=Cucumis melo var. makuwa TaxID=1194695 RepID=A0A5A7U8K6_CUCMM|nr:uncharacterized protein E6C27_scaffold60G00190 [Cucumis melo var. makuwa]
MTLLRPYWTNHGKRTTPNHAEPGRLNSRSTPTVSCTNHSDGQLHELPDGHQSRTVPKATSRDDSARTSLNTSAPHPRQPKTFRSNSRFLGATFSNVSECREENVNLRENIGVRDTMDDEMVEMIHDLHGPMFEECRRESNEQDESDKISGMFSEIEEELYPRCLKFASFNFLVKLMHIKIMYRLTNVRIVESLDIEDMRWHKDKRCETEGILRHPADTEGWKHFDEQYPCFALDTRNVRLAFSSDRFNPFGNMSTSYIMWPVILIPYNLPPWKCMKASFTFLFLLIPGPRSPGKEIDIFLEPLINELNELCVDGI